MGVLSGLNTFSKLLSYLLNEHIKVDDFRIIFSRFVECSPEPHLEKQENNNFTVAYS